jgi:hypothetical protein
LEGDLDEVVPVTGNHLRSKGTAKHPTPSLPKTRSGKIMRRILRKIAANDLKELGDTSTLADPAVVDDLIKHRAGT